MWKGGRLLGVTAALTFSSLLLACEPDPVLTAPDSKNGYMCAPLDEAQSFSTEVYTDSLVPGQIHNVDALCKLTQALSRILGSTRQSKLLFIPAGMTEADFKSTVGRFLGVNDERLKHYFDGMQKVEDPIIGAQTLGDDGVQRAFVVVDSTREEPEARLAAAITSAVLESTPNDLNAGECSPGVITNYSKAYSVWQAVHDAGNINENLITEAPIICAISDQASVAATLTLDQGLYAVISVSGISDLASQALGTDTSP